MNQNTDTPVDLRDPSFLENPYPTYARLRALDVPYWLEHHQDTSSPGLWLLSRHADAVGIFRETEAISKTISAIRTPGTATAFDRHLLYRDGDDHLRLRRLIADFFARKTIAQLEAIITDTADQLLDELCDRPTFDLAADFATPLPLTIIARVIGIPAGDMRDIRNWSTTLAVSFDSTQSCPENLLEQRTALQAFLAYIDAQVRLRRSAPDSSMLGYLVAAQGRGEIEADELSGMIGLLLLAGHETTISLIAIGSWLLLNHRDQWNMLCATPALATRAVEEILRFESPTQRSTFRVVKESFSWRGHRFAPGDQISVIIGSANRDELVFDRPDRFDITRLANRHVAFGHGLHDCVGKWLARTEGQIALQRLVMRMPDLQLDPHIPPVWNRNSFFRGMRTLPVRRAA